MNHQRKIRKIGGNNKIKNDMEHHRNSSKLNKRYLCTYSDVKKVTSKKPITGYKLVMDNVQNYYSVGTGCYRYKTGRIKRRSSDYSNLYRDTEFYCEEMNDKTAMFTSIEDLDKFYPDAKDDDEVCILKITISGNMISAMITNQFHTCHAYAGDTIEKIERLKP